MPDMPLARLRARMIEQGLDVMLVRHTANIRWLTGFIGVFDSEQAHMAFVSANHAVIKTDSRYSTAMKQRSKGSEWVVDSKRRPFQAFLEDWLGRVLPAGIISLTYDDLIHGRFPKIGEDLQQGNTATIFDDSQQGYFALIDEDSQQGGVAKTDVFDGRPVLRIGIEDGIPLREYRSLCTSLETLDIPYTLIETQDLLLWLRATKTAKELACCRAAGEISSLAFTHMCNWLKPGITERQAAFELEDYMRAQGSQCPSFATIICTGAHAASPHAIPDDTIIKQGDLLLMDYGAVVDDYHADITRVIAIGNPSAHQCEIYQIVRRAHEVAAAAIRPGISGEQIHELAAHVIKEAGYGKFFGHSLGHGVGLEIHECPNLAPGSTSGLEIGSVVTVEPGIYLPGDLGVRLEDFGVVTAEGFDSFITAPHDLITV